MCGVFNYDQRDDLSMQNGEITVNSAEFGNSWKTDSKCTKDMPLTGLINDACHTSSHYHREAEEACQAMQSGLII